MIVEGRSDKWLVMWFLRHHGLDRVQVYAVSDRVDVPPALVLSHNAETGARGEVLALALEAESWALPNANLTSVIDLDRDCLVAPREGSLLLTTDFGSLDVYSYAPAPLQKFVDVVVGVGGDARELIEEITPVLVELFLVRAAMHEVAQVGLIKNYASLCDWRRGLLQSADLVRRSLDAAGHGGLHGQVLARVEALRTQLPSDLRRAIRGHDIAPVLIQRLGLRNDWAKSEVVEQALRGCLDPDALSEAPLFAELLRRGRT